MSDVFEPNSIAWYRDVAERALREANAAKKKADELGAALLRQIEVGDEAIALHFAAKERAQKELAEIRRVIVDLAAAVKEHGAPNVVRQYVAEAACHLHDEERTRAIAAPTLPAPAAERDEEIERLRAFGERWNPRIGDVWEWTGGGEVRQHTVSEIVGDGVREPRGVRFAGHPGARLLGLMSREHGWRLLRRGPETP